ncbi:transmembrane protein 256 homolog [Neocloeon triangulifer]|uniref:transmembrane protein 256 homolog n=1 Tax=Neocloeon triangulifer TaxID=2078957 RepID=UPI00286F793B|nr:transmembrane protein 256 homolog [Neocloeon triangulifer]
MSVEGTVNYILFDNPVSKIAVDCLKKGGSLLGVTKQTASKATQKGATMASSAAANSLSRMAKSCGPFVRIGGLSGAASVGLGAYGAHSLLLKEDVSDERKRAFSTANQYHFLHSLALLAVPLCRRPVLSGSLMLSGLVLFCGPCYHFALTGETTIKPVTPYGGILLIVAWLSLCL